MLQLLPLLLLLSTGHCAKRSTHDFSSSFPQPCRVSIPGPIMKRREDSERLTDLPGSHSWWTGERGMCAQLALFPPRSQYAGGSDCGSPREIRRARITPWFFPYCLKKKKYKITFVLQTFCKPCAISAPAHQVTGMEPVPRGLFPGVQLIQSWSHLRGNSLLLTQTKVYLALNCVLKALINISIITESFITFLYFTWQCYLSV